MNTTLVFFISVISIAFLITLSTIISLLLKLLRKKGSSVDLEIAEESPPPSKKEKEKQKTHIEPTIANE